MSEKMSEEIAGRDFPWREMRLGWGDETCVCCGLPVTGQFILRFIPDGPGGAKGAIIHNSAECREAFAAMARRMSVRDAVEAMRRRRINGE